MRPINVCLAIRKTKALEAKIRLCHDLLQFILRQQSEILRHHRNGEGSP
jgi:hypothetical protein